MGMVGGCDSDKPSIIEWGIIIVMISGLFSILIDLIGGIR